MRARQAGPATTGEIADRYDAFAGRYALLDRLEPVTGLRWLRRRHLRAARGRVLLVAAGTGMDLRALPGARDVVATDASAGMLAIAADRVDRAGRDRKAGRAGRAGRDGQAGRQVRFCVMDAQSLAVRDGAFDTVVATLSLCTFPEPVAALREIARVCRADGQVLLLDHGLSDRRWFARYQRRRDAGHARALGCHVTRQPDRLVAAAGMTITRMRRMLLGTFYLIEARPG